MCTGATAVFGAVAWAFLSHECRRPRRRELIIAAAEPKAGELDGTNDWDDLDDSNESEIDVSEGEDGEQEGDDDQEEDDGLVGPSGAGSGLVRVPQADPEETPPLGALGSDARGRSAARVDRSDAAAIVARDWGGPDPTERASLISPPHLPSSLPPRGRLDARSEVKLAGSSLSENPRKGSTAADARGAGRGSLAGLWSVAAAEPASAHFTTVLRATGAVISAQQASDDQAAGTCFPQPRQAHLALTIAPPPAASACFQQELAAGSQHKVANTTSGKGATPPFVLPLTVKLPGGGGDRGGLDVASVPGQRNAAGARARTEHGLQTP